MNTKETLQMSIYKELTLSLIEILYDRFYVNPEEFTPEELEKLETAARIAGSPKHWHVGQYIEKNS